MDLSIVISTCNEPIDLPRRAIQSCLRQIDISFEVIVSDDSNTEEIKNLVVDLNDSRITYFKHKSTGIAASNWNYGISKATGKFILLLHADEYFCDDRSLIRCLGILNSNKFEAYILEVLVQHAGHNWKRSLIQKKILKLLPQSVLLFNFIGSPSNFVFKREDFMPFNSNLKLLVDVVWYAQMLRGKRFFISDHLDLCSDVILGNNVTKSVSIEKQEFWEALNVKLNLLFFEKIFLYTRVFIVLPLRCFFR